MAPVRTPQVRADPPADDSGRESLQRAIFVVLAVSCVGVPCVFTTHFQDVFYLPKLIVLWVVLVVIGWLSVVAVLLGQFRIRFIAWIDIPVAAFVSLNLLSCALSVDAHQSLFGAPLQHQGVLSLLLYVGFFYVARAVVSTPRRMVVLLGALVGGACLVSAYAISQRAGFDPIWHGYLLSGRVFSTIGQPDALAGYLVLSIPLAVGLVLITTGLSCRVSLLATGVMTTAFLFTLSRGGYVGLAVTVPFLVYGWHRRGHTIPAKVRWAAVVLGLLIVVIVGFFPGTRGVIAESWARATTIGKLSGDQSINSHLDEWRVALRVIEDHPVLGTGPDTFSTVFPRYSREVLSPGRVRYFDQYLVESPEDQFLSVAAGEGLPSLAAYLVLLVAIGWTLVRASGRADVASIRVGLIAILAAMAGYTVCASFMDAEVTGSWIFWVLSGAAISIASGVSAPWSGPAPGDKAAVSP